MGIQSFGPHFTESSSISWQEYILSRNSYRNPKAIAIDLSIPMFTALRANAGNFLAFQNPDSVTFTLLDMLAPLIALEFEIYFVLDGRRPPGKIASITREEQRKANLSRAADIRQELLTCQDYTQRWRKQRIYNLLVISHPRCYILKWDTTDVRLMGSPSNVLLQRKTYNPYYSGNVSKGRRGDNNYWTQHCRPSLVWSDFRCCLSFEN
jgi:hypothetical protein